MLGLSFIICCHNSANRLPHTLDHLARQEAQHYPWEVIVVDNGSTDNTSLVADHAWKAHGQVPLRILTETTVGLSRARLKGARNARYDLISFIDDDNWVAPDWVSVVCKTMAGNQLIGACGGQSDAQCDVSWPSWFNSCRTAYAIGEQASGESDVTWTRGYLWGAGLSIRRESLAQLLDEGFVFLLSGRRGRSFASGEDSELCMALRLAGWKLYYQPRMRLKHFIPAERLNWTYVRRLHRGFGCSNPVLDLYRKAHLPRHPGAEASPHWTRKVVRIVHSILQDHWYALDACYKPREGDIGVLKLETKFGKLSEILRLRGKLARFDELLSQAKWRHPVPRIV